MKKFLNRLLAALLLLCLYATSYGQSEAVNKSLEYFNSQTQTGYLADRCYFQRPPRCFSQGVIHDSTAITPDVFGMLYNAMNLAATQPGLELPPAGPMYMDRMEYQYPDGVVNLVGMAYRYDYIREDAVTSGLVSYTGGKFHPNVPISQILRIDTLMAVMPQNRWIYKDSVYLMYPEWTTNLADGINGLEIDAGDGQGYRAMTPGQGVWAVYPSNGVYDVLMRATGTNGSYISTHFILNVSFSSSNNSFDELNTRTRTEYNRLSPRTEDITAEESYEGKNAQVRLFILTHCDDDIIRKPFIAIDGFDPAPQGNTNHMGSMFQTDRLGFEMPLFEPNEQTLAHQHLFDAGYDLIFVDYVDLTTQVGTVLVDGIEQPVYKTDVRAGQDHVQRNALALETALKFINNEKNTLGQSSLPNVMLGMSMGGLVGKWAILDMEEKGMDHQVSLYYTFDTPHRGANIPIGLQEAVKHLIYFRPQSGKPELGETIPALKAARNTLYSPFALSRLIRHAFEPPHSPLFDQLEHEYDTKGKNGDGSFEYVTYKTIANGSIAAQNQLHNPGSEFVHIYQDNWLGMGSTDEIYNEIDTKITDKFSNWYQKFTTRGLLGGLGIFGYFKASINFMAQSGSHDVYTWAKKVKVLGITIHKDEGASREENCIGIDFCPGSFSTITKAVDGSGITFNTKGGPFIPTASVLDVKGDLRDKLFMDFSDKSSILNSGIVKADHYHGITTDNIQSFQIDPRESDGVDDDYPPQPNQLHVFVHAPLLTYVFYDLIEDNNMALNLPVLDNQTFNFGNLESTEPDYTPGHFTPQFMSRYISNSVDIINGGKITVHRSGEIGLVDGDNMPQNQNNSSLEVFIEGDGCDHQPVVVNIFENSGFSIGDHSVGNTASVFVGNRSTLNIKSGGKLDIDNGSSLIATKNSSIKVEPGGELEQTEGSEVVINDGGALDVIGDGVLNMQNAKLIVNRGGTLTIRSGATLHLIESQIIVEPGGHLIIEDSPKFTLWADAKIVVRGKADFGKIKIPNMDGTIVLATGGELQCHGDLNLKGVSRDKTLFAIEKNNAVLCDNINLSLNTGRIQGADYSDCFHFENGAKTVNLQDVDFEFGTNGLYILQSLTALNVLNSNFNKLGIAILVNLSNNATAPISVGSSVFKECTGLYLNNVGNTSITASEFIGRNGSYEMIWQTDKHGVDVNNATNLYIDQSFFARHKNGIKTTNTNTFLHCSYGINNVVGIDHFNDAKQSKTLKLVQSGLINNRVGATVNNTDFDINISSEDGIDANLFVHCNGGPDFIVPSRFQKAQESNMVGGEGESEANSGTDYREVPYIPSCGAFFRGSITNFNVANGELLAKNNMWVCLGLYGLCNWSALKDDNNNFIDLLRDPEIAYTERKNIEECTSAVEHREYMATTELQSNQYVLYPNPANNQIIIHDTEGKDFEYSISSIQGQPKIQGVGHGQKNENIESLLPGIYSI
ncbi:MAG: T9SS type A sorting domain-containing protein [Saprospiraceae bacterium]|nr:T9SS type A sorting domain-containing protein [Saprospiraceae bacterium]